MMSTHLLTAIMLHLSGVWHYWHVQNTLHAVKLVRSETVHRVRDKSNCSHKLAQVLYLLLQWMLNKRLKLELCVHRACPALCLLTHM
jgi:hypothetical protein